MPSSISGVSGWDQPVTFDDVYDWDKSTAMLAAPAPWWEPGTASGYHALNYGHLIGEVIRRISGQRQGQFFADQVAGPLSADFHIGLPLSEFSRVANLVAMDWPATDLSQLEPESVAFKTNTGPLLDLNIDLSRTERWRHADIGGAMGTAMPAPWRASSRRWHVSASLCAVVEPAHVATRRLTLITRPKVYIRVGNAAACAII